MEKKKIWVYNNNKMHFYKRIPTTNKWEEYSNKNVIDTFEFLTYDGSNIILYNRDSAKYIQLSENKVKIAIGSIEHLDSSSDDYDGFWIRSVRIDSRIGTFHYF